MNHQPGSTSPLWSDEPGRGRSGVVVVVQAFTGDEPGQPLVVGGMALVRAPSPRVAEGVDRPAEQQVGRRRGRRRRAGRAASRTRRQRKRDAEAEADEGVIEQQQVPAVGRAGRGRSGPRWRRPWPPAGTGRDWSTGPAGSRAGPESGGRPATSVKAWCLRCTATHWRGRMPVVVQIRNRNTKASHGVMRSARWARARCRYTVVSRLASLTDRQPGEDSDENSWHPAEP